MRVGYDLIVIQNMLNHVLNHVLAIGTTRRDWNTRRKGK